MVKKYINFLHFVLFFIFLSILPSKAFAQCAGNNGSVVICNISDPVNRSVSLFSYLTGTPTAGGTWTDTNNSRGLDPATGILDAQAIRQGGTYQYTYTVTSVPGCVNNTATVTVTIGAYPGVPAPFATACDKDVVFNLFTAFNSTVMGPHNNGIWRDSAGGIVSSSLPITGMKGDFVYTYTVPTIAACPTNPATISITLSVFEAPDAGTTTDLVLCGSDGLTGYTNYDLNNLISGQDPTGEWSGDGITSGNDHNVDLQDIFNTKGPGDYVYTYTAFSVPGNNICPDDMKSLVITLEKKLDFTGATLVVDSDICENEIPTATYAARLTQGAEAIPNGQYEITYAVSGPNSGSQTVTANFVNGVVNFPVSSIYFRQVGNFIINITRIVAVASKKSCTNVVNNLSDDITIYALPKLDGAVLRLSPVCQSKDAVAQLTNASQLTNGNYTVYYTIGGANNVSGQSATISVIGGNSSFTVPGIFNSNSGTSTIRITRIVNNTTNCSNAANVSGDLIIYPLPNASTVLVSVTDVCITEPVVATISGLGTLTSATLFYTLSDSNTSGLQSVVLTVSNGSADFIIPPALVSQSGNTQISLSNLVNNTTNCNVILPSISDQFLVSRIPVAPTVNGSRVFCKVEGATIADLEPQGTQYKWYNSTTATTPLEDTYVLQSENYYLREISVLGCTSSAATVMVTVNDTPAPTLNSDGQNFCGLETPRIADLSSRTNAFASVVWYDAPNNGNLLTSTTLLTDKTTYYGVDFSTVTSCISDNILEVTVSLYDCDTSQYAFFIPDGFSPNGDGVNDTFTIPDINFLYPDYTLEIFNRYGNVMFKGNRNKPDWDGKNSESVAIGDGIAPNGVYFYIVNFNKDNRRPQQGRLYLNR
ncbi:gliding motility-associated C-terminal domain-containing protein [Flavobacterium hercynium]|uniref:Ig-like domain-containing protein n=1 Tax=Flavobacterium hercynium TaxID=387094 RepID=A0A226HNC7_9FLAO|nr:gliding motility-associated C-terminal domain-containing protein [Flavobacterium hercynium]OXA95773.1 hypothetical protein B0A66_02145 [Flavobacterium hercynium]SMP16203.1 gliding motility-associated C-terminal domain-containing protein [Flavobacterium hercynium]